MRRLIPVVFTALAVAATFVLSTLRADDEDKPKYKIKEIMEYHGPKKGKLHQKVIDGKASDEEKDKLIELYEALAKNKPSKGTDESWKKLTEELVAAAKDCKEGKDGAAKRLEAAVKCVDCHKSHKK